MDFNGDDFRKALFEETRDRPNQELANAVVSDSLTAYAPVALTAGASATANIVFADINTLGMTGISAEAAFESGKWGKNGESYVDQ